MTARRLIISYDAFLIEKWNHTAQISAMLHNLTITVVNALGSKRKHPPKSAIDYHPYLKKTAKGGTRITPSNIGTLKELGKALCSG